MSLKEELEALFSFIETILPTRSIFKRPRQQALLSWTVQEKSYQLVWRIFFFMVQDVPPLFYIPYPPAHQAQHTWTSLQGLDLDRHDWGWCLQTPVLH